MAVYARLNGTATQAGEGASAMGHVRSALGRYKQGARWSPLVALAAGFWAADPDAALRSVTFSVTVGLIIGLELRDRRARRRDGPRSAPRCDCRERVLAGEKVIARVATENAALRATVADWDTALRAVGLASPRRITLGNGPDAQADLSASSRSATYQAISPSRASRLMRSRPQMMRTASSP